MPRKGMGSVFYNQASPAPAVVHAFRETLMEDNIASAERIITRWDPDGGSDYAKITSLFHESRDEAAKFIHAVHDVHQAMLFFSSSATKSSTSYTAVLVRAQGLMQIAMNRLQKEFHQILLASREALADYSENSLQSSARSSLSDVDNDDIFQGGSVSSSLSPTDDEGDDANGSVPTTGAYRYSSQQQRLVMPPAVTDALRSIAHCMISTGYAYECIEVYKRVRTSIVHDGLVRLGFELSASSGTKSQNKKKKSKKINHNSVSRDNDDSQVLDRHVTDWVAAAPAAVRTLFAGERLLSDIVFGGHGSGNPTHPGAVPVEESSFALIATDAAVRFFAFPETVAARILDARSSRSSSRRAPLQPERIFGLLDMYNALADLWPLIESVFPSASTSHVQKQVHATLARLAEAVRAMITDFEQAIHKDRSKTIAHHYSTTLHRLRVLPESTVILGSIGYG